MADYRRGSWFFPVGRALFVVWLSTGWTRAGDAPMPGDDATFRPTVMVHKGNTVGTGTVIASVEDETLILTACHVVDEAGPLTVDINRFNLGLERSADKGSWPRRLNARLVARDPSSDLAILLLKGQLALPYVARLARGDAGPEKGALVTSIGFDKGERLVGMNTRVRTSERINLGRGGEDRVFVVTETPPEHGRSGGGLFRPDGSLVGVCIARAEFNKGPAEGLFTPLASVKALLRSKQELAAAVVRSSSRPRSASR